MRKHYEKAQMREYYLEVAELISTSPGNETPGGSEVGHNDEEGEMANGRRFYEECWK